MTSLPLDLYTNIVSHSTLETLLQLCYCSRAWYSVAASQLYSNISWELYDTVAVGFMRTIASNEWLGSKVSTLDIHWKSDQAHLFAPALCNMPNLEHLRAYNLARSCKANLACVVTLLSLKKLRSISWCWCESFDLDVILDRLHPLHRIAWEWDGHTSDALESLVARSHAGLRTLKLEDYPFENIRRRLTNSAQFSRLTTIDVFRISLSALTGSQFPALRKINARYITDLGLLRDPNFLPALQSISLVCDYSLEDTTILQNLNEPGHSRAALRAGRRLSFLGLDVTDVDPAIVGVEDLVGNEAINRFTRYLEPFRPSNLYNISIFVDNPAQVKLVMGCLGLILAEEHALRVLAVHIGRSREGFTSITRCLCELAAKHMFQRLRYLRLTVPERDDLLGEQTGHALSSMPLVNIAHLVAPEADGATAMACAWTRSTGSWDEWRPDVDPYSTMPWPYWVLELDGEDLLAYIDSISA